MNKLAFFDVDGTLYKGNSTFDFIEYVNRSNKEYSVFRDKYRYLRIYNKVLNTFFHYDWYKLKSAEFLAGYSNEKLELLAHSFYQDVLLKNEIQPVLDLLSFYKANNYQVVLVTATFDPIVKIIAQYLGVNDYFCTRLVYKNGICTGKYEKDILNDKLSIVSEKYNLSNCISVFYSDNHQDIPLLKKTTLGAYIVKK